MFVSDNVQYAKNIEMCVVTMAPNSNGEPTCFSHQANGASFSQKPMFGCCSIWTNFIY